MATWKKLLVSGSAISQLNNDAGYLTSVTAQTAFVSASFNGTHLIANSSEGQLNFASSSGQGLTISANAGTDTLTFGLSGIPNTSLANDGITIAGQDTSLGGTITADTIAGQISNDTITNAQLANEFVSFGGVSLNLGQTDATPAFDLQDATAYPGDSSLVTLGTVTSGDVSAILPSGTVSGSSQVDGASITNNTVSFGGVSVALNGSDATPAFNLSDATGYTGDSSLVTVGTVTSGDVSAILPAGSVSGSITSPNQGTISINGNNIDLGLQTGDSPQFTDLTVSGNLTVTGTTLQAQVTNLDIEDRYILLNSGSSTIGDSGIVFGGANGVAQSGAGLVWDASYNGNDGRLSIVNTLASNASGDTTPNYHVAGVFEGTEANAATAQADHVGNIRVESEEIYIYV